MYDGKVQFGMLDCDYQLPGCRSEHFYLIEVQVSNSVTTSVVCEACLYKLKSRTTIVDAVYLGQRAYDTNVK